MDYRILITFFLLLQAHIHRTMVVTVFEDEMELFKLFESTNDEVLNQPDPLRDMSITEKIALWELILSSTYFVDKNMQNAEPNEYNPLPGMGTPELESTMYSYVARDIHNGDKKQTRNTVLCRASEGRNNDVKKDYHIFYAYRRNTYFIGEYDSSRNEIILTGLAEPPAECVPHENHEKLEASFRAQINAANQSGIRKTSPPNSPTKGRDWGIRKLRISQKLRVCGQVFAAKYYRNKGIKFVGTKGNVKEFSVPLLVSFKSALLKKSEIYEHMFGCVVTAENGEQRIYLISNCYDFSDEQVAVYVLAHDDENDKQYLDSYVTAVTVLMPTANKSQRRLHMHH